MSHAAVLYNDTFMLDPAAMAWTTLSDLISGPVPAPRFGNGFTDGADGMLYLFGGSGNSEADPSALPCILLPHQDAIHSFQSCCWD